MSHCEQIRSQKKLFTVTTQPSYPYRRPFRIPIGNGLSTELPDDNGIAFNQWTHIATTILDMLSTLHTLHGSPLQLRHFPPNNHLFRRLNTVELRVVNNELPVNTLLGHPLLANKLHSSLTLYYKQFPAFYYAPHTLLACPARTAIPFDNWLGPMSLASGYCEAIRHQHNTLP